MPAPRRDPWIAVDATIRRNAKFAALPNDSARLGVIYLWGEAKLLRPQGSFANRGHAREVLGRFARYLGDYLREGFLEEAPELCPRCVTAWPAIRDGGLAVHDFRLHQRDPGAAERAEGWRDGQTDGAVPSPFDERSIESQSDANERGTIVEPPAGARSDSDSDSDNDGDSVSPRVNKDVEKDRAHANGPVDPSGQRAAAGARL
jgi:hypothetical protein